MKPKRFASDRREKNVDVYKEQRKYIRRIVDRYGVDIDAMAKGQNSLEIIRKNNNKGNK